MIHFGEEICQDFERATSREWLETNGIGGFASGTISGANSRRYHGLLTAATKPPLGRLTILSKFEESVVIDGIEYQLSSNRFAGGIFPKGFQYLREFRLDPFPIWTYQIDGIEIEKKVFMRHGHNTTVCRWTALGNKEGRMVEMRLRPLLAFSDYHSLQHESRNIRVGYSEHKGVAAVRLHDSDPQLYLYHNAVELQPTGFWYKDFEYSIEQERGFDNQEDLYQPFVMLFDLSSPATISATLEERPDETAYDVLEMSELFRRETLMVDAAAEEDMYAQLVLAADQFIVERGKGQTVIAGYPWFSDWGRDTMIALPGLTLKTNRPEVAKGILLEFAEHISEGMIPNRFPDAGETADYNTVDATLWFIEAIRAYIEHTGDLETVREHLYLKMAGIIAWHLRGTRYHIKLDTDGLLFAGEPGVQLTWMDAKYGREVFTPRIGKPVEIQALWFNALRIMADLAEKFGDHEDKNRYDAMADLCSQSFNAVFWNDQEQCLFDVVHNGTRDASVRPNQLFAVSLKHSMLDGERSRKILRKATEELLTPVGLRSLSPHDRKYCPVYIGSPYKRDSSYHQGTVWGWLIGPYINAYRRVNADVHDLDDKVAGLLEGFRKHLSQAGVGQISEIFDGDAPHLPRGCPAQAWSVAEVIRVIPPSDKR